MLFGWCNIYFVCFKIKRCCFKKDATVWSASEHAVEYSSNLADVILVEPQLKGSYEKIKADNPDKPVILISDDDFKNFNAQKIFDMAYDACQK